MYAFLITLGLLLGHPPYKHPSGATRHDNSEHTMQDHVPTVFTPSIEPPHCFTWNIGGHPNDAPYWGDGVESCHKDTERTWVGCVNRCDECGDPDDRENCLKVCNEYRHEWRMACHGVISAREWARPYYEEQERLRGEKMRRYEENGRRAREHNKRVRASKSVTLDPCGRIVTLSSAEREEEACQPAWEVLPPSGPWATKDDCIAGGFEEGLRCLNRCDDECKDEHLEDCRDGCASKVTTHGIRCLYVWGESPGRLPQMVPGWGGCRFPYFDFEAATPWRNLDNCRFEVARLQLECHAGCDECLPPFVIACNLICSRLGDIYTQDCVDSFSNPP